MSLSGASLGADLADLYDAGHYKLPQVAAEFRQAGGSLNSLSVIGALLRRDSELGGSSGPAAAPFDDLRDAIVDILVKTADNMDDTGAALVLGATEYAKTDEGAAAMYKKLKGQLDAANGKTG
jgi:hypothetical protein